MVEMVRTQSGGSATNVPEVVGSRQRGVLQNNVGASSIRTFTTYIGGDKPLPILVRNERRRKANIIVNTQYGCVFIGGPGVANNGTAKGYPLYGPTSTMQPIPFTTDTQDEIEGIALPGTVIEVSVFEEYDNKS